MAEKETKVSEPVEKKDNAEKKPAPKKEKVKLGERIKKFWSSYKSEFKKIAWPSKEETTRSTVVVIASIVIFAIVIGILDYLFSNGLTLLSHL